jgi:hypothetical protein
VCRLHIYWKKKTGQGQGRCILIYRKMKISGQSNVLGFERTENWTKFVIYCKYHGVNIYKSKDLIKYLFIENMGFIQMIQHV